MRCQNDHPLEGGGWLHLEHKAASLPAPSPEPVVRLATSEVERIAKQCCADPTKQDRLAKLAIELGVSEAALLKLRVGIGYDYNGNWWYGFPSRDSQGNIVGITRRYPNGSKKTLKGTCNGLFYCTDWKQHSGPVLIVEGPSDVAAGIDSNLTAIGRPSNLAGVAELKRLLAGCGRLVVVIGENDEKPEKRGLQVFCPSDCRGCAHCFPGLIGAQHVAKCLKTTHCLPPAGCKDLREVLHRPSIWSDLVNATNQARRL